MISNCVALYVLGVASEHAFGTMRTGALYFVTGLGAALASMGWSPGPSVGASGAVFGLMGAVIVFFGRHRERILLRDRRIGGVLAGRAAYTLLIGLLTPYVDNMAHPGGLVPGAAAGWVTRSVVLERS